MNKIKTTIPIILLVFSTYVVLHAVGASVFHPDSTVRSIDDIDLIRAEYKKINTLKLRALQFKYENLECVDEGETTYYLQDDKVRKIVEKFIKGDGYTLTEYYFKDHKFIFALEIVIGGPAIGPETKTEYRYYVKNDKALRQMEGRKIVVPDTKFTEVLTNAYRLLKARNAKNFNEVICNFE